MSDYATPSSISDPQNSEIAESTIHHHLHSRKHPCILCQQRKVKCDRNIPCANCRKGGVDCISTASLPPKKRKKRFSEAELLARLRRYEEHLIAYGADLKAINDGAPVQKRGCKQRVYNKVGTDDKTADERPDFLALRKSLKNVKNNLWDGVNEDFRETEEILQGSSEDEISENPITTYYDETCGGAEDFFLPAAHVNPLVDLHPPPVQIFQLWQIFLYSINPLTKIFHAPTVQVQILDAASDTRNIDQNFEPLLFSIYSMAIYSLGADECRDKFGQERDVLLARYQSGARLAFHQAGLLKSSELSILQSLVLYLNSCVHSSTDPRSLFCLSGIGIRMAQRMGLHSDGTDYGLSPFQVELRRRTWWQLILFDARIADISGAGSSILTYHWTTKLPSNVNDSDLFLDMKEPPVEHHGLTEMVFVLQRCEILQRLQEFALPTGTAESKTELIDDLEDRLQRRYIDYCDLSIPVHSISVLLTKMSLSKYRLGHRPNLLLRDLATNLPEESERPFRHALNMIEVHNQMLKNSSLQHFHWYAWTQFPLRAHIYILIALRYHMSEELSGRAWIQIAEAYSSEIGPFSQSASHTSLHHAVGNLTIRAWEARERALREIDAHEMSFHVPRFISVLRHRLLEKKQTSSKTSKDNSPRKMEIDTIFLEHARGWNWQEASTNSVLGNLDGPMFQGVDHIFPCFMTQDQTPDWGTFDNSTGREHRPGANSY